MRELTLKELQEISLDILKDVHQFCVKNNIKYSLAYGTLIGAIRHKGFIPWDDDVDIIMPRPDYERFCSTFASIKYHVSSFETDSDCRMTFGRVFDDNQTFVRSFVPWHLKEHGAWIDVFPVDAAEDNFEQFSERIARIYPIFRKLQRNRKGILHFSFSFSLKTQFRLLIKKVVFLNGWLVPNMMKMVIKEAKKYEFGSTKHWGLIAFNSYGIKDYHEDELFDEVVDVEFEHHNFKALRGYDEYLRQIYGDYMQLPPEENRKPKQTYIHVYWKD